MTTYMYEKMLAVTNRKLCSNPFLEQIERLASRHPAGIILREKDLTEQEYEQLASKVLKICKEKGTPCILHTWMGAAKRLGCDQIHLPLWKLEECAGNLKDFKTVGVSVHTVSEAVRALQLGAGYLTAGHIFATDCKKGVPGRGLEFLKEVCSRVSLPVYAIGGITPDNAGKVLEQGAAGYCVMSGVMQKI